MYCEESCQVLQSCWRKHGPLIQRSKGHQAPLLLLCLLRCLPSTWITKQSARKITRNFWQLFPGGVLFFIIYLYNVNFNKMWWRSNSFSSLYKLKLSNAKMRLINLKKLINWPALCSLRKVSDIALFKITHLCDIL